jgi:hypothetical protein
MECGLLIRYGRLVPGREKQAMELFQETMAYMQDKLAQGEITFFEPFFMATSDLEEELGFWLVKGPAPEIFKTLEEEGYRTLMQKALMLVEHVRTDLLTVGEGIVAQFERSLKIQAELAV